MNKKKLLTSVMGNASSAPYIDYNFDNGNIQSYTISGSTIRLEPFGDCYYYPPAYQSQWFAIRTSKLGGQKPVFLVAKNKLWVGYTNGSWFGAWSTALDTDTWYQFDNMVVGTDDYSFYNDTLFPYGMIYISLMPAYPYSRVQRKIAEWSANSLITETPSTTNKIFGYTATVTPDSHGRGKINLPYYAFKITSGSGTKLKAILSSGMHGCEPQARFAFEGAIDWLLTTSVKQAFLLDYFDFYCYPTLMPLNLVNGHSRNQWSDYSADAQRWATSGSYDHVDKHKTAWDTDISGSISAGIDFHGYASSDANGMGDIYDATDPMVLGFRDQMIKYEAGYDLLEEELVSILPYYWTTSLSAVLSITQEQRQGKTRAISGWKTFGVNTLNALTDMISGGYFAGGPPVGSYDFNGTTDRIDWDNVYDPANTPTTIAMWIYLDRDVTAQYPFCISSGSNNTYSMWFATNTTTASALQFGTVSTVDKLSARYVSGGQFPRNSWIQLTGTYSGSFGPYTSLKIYKNGTECTYLDIGSASTTGIETPHTGVWSLMGRKVDNLRNVDGKACQIGVWDRVLTQAEITNLGAGYSPELIPTNLKFYFKGNTTSLINEITGISGSADGTTFISGSGNGPSIIY